MYFVYVLKSNKDNKLYTGITNNLDRRIRQHNRGDPATPSTKNRGSFTYVYHESVKTRSDAREREKYLKSGVGREWLANNHVK